MSDQPVFRAVCRVHERVWFSATGATPYDAAARLRRVVPEAVKANGVEVREETPGLHRQPPWEPWSDGQ